MATDRRQIPRVLGLATFDTATARLLGINPDQLTIDGDGRITHLRVNDQQVELAGGVDLLPDQMLPPANQRMDDVLSVEIDGTTYYINAVEQITPDFAIRLVGAPGEQSWFTAPSNFTVTVEAVEGTINQITSATLNGVTGLVTGGTFTINFDADDVRDPGSNTIEITASGMNADGEAQTASARHTFNFHRDFFFLTNGPNGTDPTSTITQAQLEPGRINDAFGGTRLASGPTWVAVATTGTTVPDMWVTDNMLLGMFPSAPTQRNSLDITISGETHNYTAYYLGNYRDANMVRFVFGG